MPSHLANRDHEEPDPAPNVPQALADALRDALRARRLRVRVLEDETLLVSSPEGHFGTGDEVRPSLNQEVTCRRRHPSGPWWWHWVWSGPDRHSPKELEPLGPAAGIEHAADLIARVVAIPPDQREPSSDHDPEL
jgi:hypothetical protein